MEKILILEWADLQKENWDALLLGNGASIAIDDRFRYPSLYEKAYPKEEKSTERKLFEKLKTSDFEQVLLACRHAELVNDILEKDGDEIKRISTSIRKSLIDAVRAVHPEYDAVRAKLLKAATFASLFKTVINLNYDLTFYWGFLLFNDSDERHRNHFKDGFLKPIDGKLHQFDENWERLRTPHAHTEKATLIFYPHGNLCLSRHFLGHEFKVSVSPSSTQPLLEKITEKWKKPGIFPLYVSEGTSDQKKAAIRRSAYLSNVYEKALKKLHEPEKGAFLVYGWSLSDGDDHILEALTENKPRKIGISVHTDMDPAKKQAFCHRVKAKIIEKSYKLHKKTHLIETVFFESQSDDCWIN
jgi:hypothetical protein